MLCPKCQTEQPEGNRYCSTCGNPLTTSDEPDSYLHEQLKSSVLLMNENRFKEAYDLLTELRKKYPENAIIYNNLGWLYLKQNNRAEALRWLNKALELDPTNKTVKRNLQLVYPEKIAFKRALDIFSFYILTLWVISTVYIFSTHDSFANFFSVANSFAYTFYAPTISFTILLILCFINRVFPSLFKPISKRAMFWWVAVTLVLIPFTV